jgi:TPR repeat protein
MERCYLTNYIDELKAFADGGDLDAQVLWADSQLRVSDEVINAYRDAAEKGNKYGQFRYAECLLSGISIVRDSGERTEFISANPDEALRLLSLSSSQGHPHAKCLLAAQLYSSDKERAIELYEEAAGLGDTASMFALTTITDNIEPLLRGGWSHKWEIAPLWTKSLEYSVPNWPGTSR